MRFNFSNYFRRRAAFTAVEAIIVIGIFTLVALMIIGWQKDVFTYNSALSGRLRSQEEMRETLKDFVAETRTAQTSNLGSYPIEQANKDSFVFYSDIDDDGLKERVRYFLSGNILKKGVIKPTGQPLTYNPANEKISEAVHNMVNASGEVFAYYDENYSGSEPPLTQPVNISDVRLVKITLTVDENVNRPPTAISETTQVSIRNLKDNL